MHFDIIQTEKTSLLQNLNQKMFAYPELALSGALLLGLATFIYFY